MSRIYDELLECNKTHEITLRILQIIVICHEKLELQEKRIKMKPIPKLKIKNLNKIQI